MKKYMSKYKSRRSKKSKLKFFDYHKNGCFKKECFDKWGNDSFMQTAVSQWMVMRVYVHQN